MGFLDRTSRGRMVTRRAYEHLQIPIPDRGPKSDQTTMF